MEDRLLLTRCCKVKYAAFKFHSAIAACIMDICYKLCEFPIFVWTDCLNLFHLPFQNDYLFHFFYITLKWLRYCALPLVVKGVPMDPNSEKVFSKGIF